MDATFKTCPTCNQAAPLDALQCARCGHGFRTQFAPNQTQAFNSNVPPNPVAPGYYNFTPPGYSPMNSVYTFARGIPVWGCFMIGFFMHLVAIVLMVFYFGDYPSHDSARGHATAWGFVASFLMGCVFFVPFFLLALLKAH